MLKTIKNQHKLLLSLLFSTMIFLSRIWYIRECNVLAIRNDEYGYWNHAALFSTMTGQTYLPGICTGIPMATA